LDFPTCGATNESADCLLQKCQQKTNSWGFGSNLLTELSVGLAAASLMGRPSRPLPSHLSLAIFMTAAINLGLNSSLVVWHLPPNYSTICCIYMRSHNCAKEQIIYLATLMLLNLFTNFSGVASTTQAQSFLISDGGSDLLKEVVPYSQS
jgi:hypothetical protein